MKVHYIKVRFRQAQEKIEELKSTGEFLSGFKIKRVDDFVMIPVKYSGSTDDFKPIAVKRMSHVGSFERISDFFVIKERDGWENVLEELKEKQNPRAVFLDKGVEGKFRLRNIERVYGSGEPEGIHRENGLRYKVNLHDAYFSPRLGGLRKHICQEINDDKDAVAVDMYAGVGPITIPLLKKGIDVTGIDLNRRATKLLKLNMKLNSVLGNVVLANSNEMYTCLKKATHIIMNNPSQPVTLSNSIIQSFRSGTMIHFTHLLMNDESLNIGGTIELERKVVHGYSPSSSLYYLRLRRI